MQRKVAIITGDGRVALQTEALPPAGPQDITIQVEASLISPGTELSMIASRLANPQPDAKPQPFGYACAGVVLKVPDHVTDFTPGQRVVAMGAGKALHAEIVQVPRNLVIPIPDDLPASEAVYACLGATALQAMRRAGPTLGEYGLVLGLGIVGNLAAQLSQLAGARVAGWDGLPGRRHLAAACGIATVFDHAAADTIEKTTAFAAPYGMDFALFAFGGNATPAYEAVKQVMKLSADGHRMGRIVLVGGCQVQIEGGAPGGNLDVLVASRTGPGYHDPAWEEGASYPAVFVPFTTGRNLREIVTLLAEKRLKVTPLTTHEMPLAEVAEATELLSNQPDKALGIVLTQKV